MKRKRHTPQEVLGEAARGGGRSESGRDDRSYLPEVGGYTNRLS